MVHNPTEIITDQQGEERDSKKRANFIGAFTVLGIAILLVFSGDIGWTWMWVYTAVTVATLLSLPSSFREE